MPPLPKISLWRSAALRAFTLLECLVVVAIAAILAGLLFPALNRGVEKARLTQCSGNIRQVAAALLAYAADHDGMLPPVNSMDWLTPDPLQKRLWPYKVWTYAGYEESAWEIPVNEARCVAGAVTKNIFRCPMNWKTPQTVPGTSQGINPNRFSYGLNTRPARGPHLSSELDNDLVPIRLAGIGSPSRTLMLNENSFCMGSFESFRHWTGLIPHEGGSNLAFFDGHVEWRKLKDIPGPGTAEGRVFWDGTPGD